MASGPDPLARLLQVNRLDATTQTEVLRSYFGTKHQRPARYFSDFIAYYTEEPRKLQTGLTRSDWPIPSLGEKTHRDILDITTILKDNRDQKRTVIRQMLSSQQQHEDESSLDHLCDLAVRMWLMINVLDAEISLVDDEAPRKPWLNSQSLDDLINDQSREDLWIKVGMDTMSSKSPQARSRKKVLWIFPYKAFLQGQLDYQSDELSNLGALNTTRMIFPEGLLRETILTLNLLFPGWDPSTHDMLSRHNQQFHEQEPLDEPGRLSLQEFLYWRDRLLDLYEVVFLAPPDDWRQLWADRRNPLQWYTFWIALIVLVLSIVSCVASVLQTWATLKSLYASG